jgi:two-component system chemotaxis response regulator CheY
MKKVLIVDDSAYMRSMIASALNDTKRYTVLGQAVNGNQAVELALELNPDLITMDNILPDMLGVDVVRELRQEKIGSKILMVSAVGQDTIITESLASGADNYLVKPFTPETLIDKVDALFA